VYKRDTVSVNDGANFALSSPLNINNNSSFVNYSKSGVFLSGGLNNNSNLENYGRMDVSGNLHNNSQATLVNNCHIELAGNFFQNGDFDLFGYLNVNGKSTFNSANGNNDLHSGALLATREIMVNEAISGVGSSYAAITVSQRTHINSQGGFYGNLDLCDADGIEVNNGTMGVDVTNCQAYVPASGTCNPGTGSAPQTDWILVADVAAPTTPGGQKLSATCIQLIGDYAYVSWHLNAGPADYSGLLEVYNIANPSMPLIVSSLWSTDIDFNHLYVELSEIAPGQRRLWAVGSRNIYSSGLSSPAWLGEFTLTNNIFTMNTFLEEDLPSFSGNSVIKFSNSLLLTSGKSNGALTSYDLASQELNQEAADERMKYLDIDGQKMIALQQGNTNSTLYSYSLPNPDFRIPQA